MALLVGYLLAATGPVLAGALYDAAGSYRVPFLALAGIGVATLAIGVSVPPAATTSREVLDPGVAEPVPISEAQPATPERQGREVPRSWTSGW
jgi:MFS family permease